jgi:hypothetical protein
MTSPPRPGGPDRRKLIEAYQEVVRSEREKRVSGPLLEPEPPRRRFALLMALMAAGLAALLVLQPAWLFSSAPPPEPPAVQEASLRLTMFRAIELINAYRAVQGRLPTTLAEAGADTTGLRYERTADGYTVTGTNGPRTLTYTWPADPHEFLGNSYQIIRQRRSP